MKFVLLNLVCFYMFTQTTLAYELDPEMYKDFMYARCFTPAGKVVYDKGYMNFPTAFHSRCYAGFMVGDNSWKNIDSSKYYGMLKLKKVKKQREILESSPFVDGKSSVSRKKREVEYYTSFSDLIFIKTQN